MNKFFSIFCLITVVLLFSSCDMPDYTDEISAAYFNAGGSSGTAVCTYGQYRCSGSDSYFCGYSGNDLLWLLSQKCSYGCDSSTGKCKSSNDSGSGSNSGGNNSGSDSGNSGGNSDTSSPLCNPNPCENLANSTGICTTTHDDYVCGCKEGYNWRHKECVQIPKALGNICTGHTKCYTDSSSISCNSLSIGNFYGQDAHYAAQGTCIPRKFRIDSSVSSEKTVIDENTGLEWQQTISDDKFSQENAVQYCENLNYGGHNDWRLPTPYDFLTIIDYGNDYGSRAGLDTAYFDVGTYDDLWTSHNLSNDKWLYWLYSYYGWLSNASESDKYKVKCVRGKDLPIPSLTISTINGDEIITDSVTGLMWQKSIAYYYWEDALSYCEKLTYAGYSDWRMPNINELFSLVNYDDYNPASDFPDIKTNELPFWSSTADEWSSIAVYFVQGTHSSESKKDSAMSRPVRCVR